LRISEDGVWQLLGGDYNPNWWFISPPPKPQPPKKAEKVAKLTATHALLSTESSSSSKSIWMKKSFESDKLASSLISSDVTDQPEPAQRLGQRLREAAQNSPHAHGE
jgi:hypothetical protein